MGRPALEGLDLPECRLRLPPGVVEPGQLHRRICSRVQQIGQQPDHLAAVDAVLDHPHGHSARMRGPLAGQAHPRQVCAVRQVLDRTCRDTRTGPHQQVRPGPGVGLPQRHPGKASVHDDQHPGGRVGRLDRQLGLTAAEATHRRVDLRVRAALGQRHHSHLREPRRPAVLGRPAERRPVRLRVRRVQHEPVDRSQPHPAVEGALRADRGQGAGQLAEQGLQNLWPKTSARPRERRLVRDAGTQLRDAAYQLLGDIVIGVLLEQRQGKGEVDHEPCRQRAGLLVPDPAAPPVPRRPAPVSPTESPHPAARDQTTPPKDACPAQRPRCPDVTDCLTTSSNGIVFPAAGDTP